MEKLTEKGKEFMESMYEEDIKETKDNFFPDVSMEVMIASLNYSAECDEDHPDFNFIHGVMWERKRQRKVRKVVKGKELELNQMLVKDKDGNFKISFTRNDERKKRRRKTRKR